MGATILSDLVKTIDSFGIATQIAWPGQKAALITEPVAAVSLESADMAAGTITVLVTVVSPMDRGGVTCEDAALRIADLMHQNNRAFQCTVGSCKSDERAGVFFIHIRGTIHINQEEEET